jgi:S1-C subfamily serine protease
MAHRVLRSNSRTESTDVLVSPTRYQLKQDLAQAIQPLSGKLTSKLTGLSKQDLATLHLKRSKLRSPSCRNLESISDVPHNSSSTAFADAAHSTLVFAQHEAGTAVCISASGLILTCSHCVAESQEEYEEGKSHWLIFSSGRVVQTTCVAWDARRDLALLQIVAAERSEDGLLSTFPFVTVASKAPAAPRTKKTPLICIGHPGSEDLEVVTTSAPVPTNYNVLHVSYGHYRGMATGQDVHDNSDIGALKHDCWTYWGHSGAPLIAAESGEVVGLHSSWDDQTGMRRGIGWEAIDGFLGDWCTKL